MALGECVLAIAASRVVSIVNKSSLKKNFLLFEFHIQFLLFNWLLCRSSVESCWKYINGVQISKAVLRGFLIRFHYITYYIVMEWMWEQEEKGNSHQIKAQVSTENWVPGGGIVHHGLQVLLVSLVLRESPDIAGFQFFPQWQTSLVMFNSAACRSMGECRDKACGLQIHLPACLDEFRFLWSDFFREDFSGIFSLHSFSSPSLPLF